MTMPFDLDKGESQVCNNGGLKMAIHKNRGLKCIVTILRLRGFRVFVLTPVGLVEVDAESFVPVRSQAWCITSNVVALAPGVTPSIVQAYAGIATKSIKLVE